RMRAQDLALAAREVVLGLARDRLEQRRAALVVKPFGRQLLRRRRQPAPRLGAQQRDTVSLGQQDVDVDVRRVDFADAGHRRAGYYLAGSVTHAAYVAIEPCKVKRRTTKKDAGRRNDACAVTLRSGCGRDPRRIP